MNNVLRWKQRFSNFQNAYVMFQRRIDEFEQNPAGEAYQMSLVQAFKIIIELSWKTLKDYLENQGYDTVKNGKQTIRQAFQDEIIHEAEIWMSALEIRNETSHTYNPAVLKKVLEFVSKDFYSVLKDLNFQLQKLSN